MGWDVTQRLRFWRDMSDRTYLGTRNLAYRRHLVEEPAEEQYASTTRRACSDVLYEYAGHACMLARSDDGLQRRECV